jgi:hypothetical protein
MYTNMHVPCVHTIHTYIRSYAFRNNQKSVSKATNKQLLSDDNDDIDIQDQPPQRKRGRQPKNAPQDAAPADSDSEPIMKRSRRPPENIREKMRSKKQETKKTLEHASKICIQGKSKKERVSDILKGAKLKQKNGSNSKIKKAKNKCKKRGRRKGKSKGKAQYESACETSEQDDGSKSEEDKTSECGTHGENEDQHDGSEAEADEESDIMKKKHQFKLLMEYLRDKQQSTPDLQFQADTVVPDSDDDNVQTETLETSEREHEEGAHTSYHELLQTSTQGTESKAAAGRKKKRASASAFVKKDCTLPESESATSLDPPQPKHKRARTTDESETSAENDAAHAEHTSACAQEEYSQELETPSKGKKYGQKNKRAGANDESAQVVETPKKEAKSTKQNKCAGAKDECAQVSQTPTKDAKGTEHKQAGANEDVSHESEAPEQDQTSASQNSADAKHECALALQTPSKNARNIKTKRGGSKAKEEDPQGFETPRKDEKNDKREHDVAVAVAAEVRASEPATPQKETKSIKQKGAVAAAVAAEDRAPEPATPQKETKGPKPKRAGAKEEDAKELETPNKDQTNPKPKPVCEQEETSHTHIVSELDQEDVLSTPAPRRPHKRNSIKDECAPPSQDQSQSTPTSKTPSKTKNACTEAGDAHTPSQVKSKTKNACTEAEDAHTPSQEKAQSSQKGRTPSKAKLAAGAKVPDCLQTPSKDKAAKTPSKGKAAGTDEHEPQASSQEQQTKLNQTAGKTPSKGKAACTDEHQTHASSPEQQTQLSQTTGKTPSKAKIERPKPRKGQIRLENMSSDSTVTDSLPGGADSLREGGGSLPGVEAEDYTGEHSLHRPTQGPRANRST